MAKMAVLLMTYIMRHVQNIVRNMEERKTIQYLSAGYLMAEEITTSFFAGYGNDVMVSIRQ